MRQPRWADGLLVVAALAVAAAGFGHQATGTSGSTAADHAPVRTTPAKPAAPPTARVRPATPGPQRLRQDDGRRVGPVRILVIGDSTSKDIGFGLQRWALTRDGAVSVTVGGAAGCGLLAGGTRVYPDGEEPVPPGCARYLEEHVPALVDGVQPDLVVVMSSWDTADRRWGRGRTLTPYDGEYQLRLQQAVRDLAARVQAAGVPHVVFALEPTTDPYWSLVDSPSEDPLRHQALHQAMIGVAGADPESVGLADLDGWLEAHGGLDSHSMRPDGVHWSDAAADLLAATYLGPLLVERARS